MRRAVLSLLLALVAAGTACGRGHRPLGRRIIVLGFDGLDYGVTRDLMARGKLPSFSKLADTGGFASLGTSTPPQSPVAWSTFITGTDPGRHGIFDFIHRDPKTMTPYLSTTMTEPPSHVVEFGKWQFPLSSGKVELLRRGRPFWDVLEQHGIETMVVRMPANFPPSGSATRELSGMGTPDVLGTYGTFSYFTSSPNAATDRSLSGGAVYVVDTAGDVVHGTVEGPTNPFLVTPEPVTSEFTVYLGADRRYAKLVAGDEERLLRVGEWSDWVPIEFEYLPTQHLRAECRFYLKQLEPDFELYVSPPNVDPMSPAVPISTPPGYARELAEATGRFYSQGMPEDTAALRAGILTPSEFLRQAEIAGEEVRREYAYTLGRFQDGFLFYYFGNVDQVSHMMWRPRDPDHPAYDAAIDGPNKHVVEELYMGLDRIVGETLATLGERDLLVVMSDHGFASWRRSFNLTTWLRDNGYLTVRDDGETDGTAPFADIDWSRTRAYALGLNGLYLNLSGREEFGTVGQEERDALLDEISRKLLATIDPATGMPAITSVFKTSDVFHLDGTGDIAPDLIIGYARGTRSSDESAVGDIPDVVFAVNRDAWSGDHCMDPAAVPGILLSNHPLLRPAPDLQSLAGAVLTEAGIDDFPGRR